MKQFFLELNDLMIKSSVLKLTFFLSLFVMLSILGGVVSFFDTAQPLPPYTQATGHGSH